MRLQNILDKRSLKGSLSHEGTILRVLLVEPKYYTKFPPLGLLKLSSYHKRKGDTILGLVKGKQFLRVSPDLVYVTSLFTWAWRDVHEAVRFYKMFYPNVKVWLGGLYASLLPEHAAFSGADYVHRGLFDDAEDLKPDYELLKNYMPKWDGSILFASRGCPRDCGFCAVPIIEGKMCRMKDSIKELIYPEYTRVILWDNNILASPKWRDIFSELEVLGLKVDFNQGLDARLLTDEVAERLARIRLDFGGGIKVRLGYDFRRNGPLVRKAIERLNAVGIKGRRIMVYTLFNYNDDPEDLFERVRNVLHWGAVCYPMRYEPIHTLDKNKWVGSKWDLKRIDMVQRARRVIGYRGTFPPYEGLIKKFDGANGFDEAFKLRPRKKKRE